MAAARQGTPNSRRFLQNPFRFCQESSDSFCLLRFFSDLAFPLISSDRLWSPLIGPLFRTSSLIAPLFRTSSLIAPLIRTSSLSDCASHQDLLALIRDVYRGASYPSLDLTRNLASGPYGDPSRYDVANPYERASDTLIHSRPHPLSLCFAAGLTPVPLIHRYSTPGAGGSFPRAISMFRTSYSHVTEIGR